MVRTYVIGDIHGGLKALRQVMERAPIRDGDRLIFLGDYVDGWSESRQVMEYLMELQGQYPCVFIKGNHDAWCEEWLEGYPADPHWLIHGGQATVDSYAGIDGKERDQHVDFFNGMLPYYEEKEEGRNLLFIHAGFTSMHGPARELHAGNFSADRTLWELALAVDHRIPKDSLSYPKRLKLYDEIFIGHTPTTNYGVEVPMQRCNIWNVDTGAAFLGRISVMDITTREYWQSDIIQRLYPDEKGRNK